MNHGTVGAYSNHHCRCAACRQAHRTAVNRQRAQRYALRVSVDGVWVAPLPADRHGRVAAYTNWGCRCRPCTDAATASTIRSRTRSASAAGGVR